MGFPVSLVPTQQLLAGLINPDVENLLKNTKNWTGTLGAGSAPDYWVDWITGGAQATYSRVTGNGFSSIALRVEDTGPTSYCAMQADNDDDGVRDVIIDVTRPVSLTLTYRASHDLRIEDHVTITYATLPSNSGNAQTTTIVLNTVAQAGSFQIRLNDDGAWMELADVILFYTD